LWSKNSGRKYIINQIRAILRKWDSRLRVNRVDTPRHLWQIFRKWGRRHLRMVCWCSVQAGNAVGIEPTTSGRTSYSSTVLKRHSSLTFLTICRRNL